MGFGQSFRPSELFSDGLGDIGNRRFFHTPLCRIAFVFCSTIVLGFLGMIKNHKDLLCLSAFLPTPRNPTMGPRAKIQSVNNAAISYISGRLKRRYVFRRPGSALKVHRVVSKAAAISAQISSASSTPMEKRSKPTLIPISVFTSCGTPLWDCE